MTGEDPFDTVPAPQMEDLPPTRRAWQRPVETCGLGGKPRKKRVDLNPHQRRWFQRRGLTFERVEHSNHYGGVTVDLFGFADWIAFSPQEGIILVQTCTHSDASKRLRKALSKPELGVWLASGGRFVVHGWRQQSGRGSRWEVVAREVQREDVEPETEAAE